MLVIIKFIVSAFVIVIITEIAKRNGTLAGLIAVLPINIVLSLLWINYETKDIVTINKFIHAAFRGLIPLACFISVMYIFHKLNVPFHVSISTAFVALLLVIFVQNKIILWIS